MALYTFLAEAFCYPVPGRLERLEGELSGQDSKAAREAVAAFIWKIAKLSLSEWEELYTRTWDLNPLAAPYVGYQIWGDGPRRSRFLSEMNRALVREGIDPGSELPDHLIPTLRYLELVQEPLPILQENLETAVKRMRTALQDAESDNPYLDLLDALLVGLKARQPSGQKAGA
jgi:nitrate reductase delta subunit